MKLLKVAERAKKAKAADRPHKAEKVYRPPGTKARTLGVFVFWMAFAFILLAFLANLLFGPSQKATETESVAANPAMSQEAVAFAEGFAATYFTWTPSAEGWEKQQAELSTMLGEGVPETAGIMQSGQEWSSAPGTIRLVEMKETGPNKSIITLEVEQILKRSKEVTEAGVEPGAETKTATHFFSVPVGFDTAYGIYELPSFTAVIEENTVVREKLRGEAVDSKIETSLKNFLPTFFQSYATDTPDKLAYVLQTGADVKGLEGSVTFEEVSEVNVIAGSEPGTYEVVAYAVMAEPGTGTKFTTVYRLTVKEQEGRFVVTQLNEGAE